VKKKLAIFNCQKKFEFDDDLADLRSLGNATLAFPSISGEIPVDGTIESRLNNLFRCEIGLINPKKRTKVT
jgi:hypothetical protein